MSRSWGRYDSRLWFGGVNPPVVSNTMESRSGDLNTSVRFSLFLVLSVVFTLHGARVVVIVMYRDHIHYGLGVRGDSLSA